MTWCLLHRLHEQTPHPLQKPRQIPTLIQSLHTRLHLLHLHLGPHHPDLIIPLLRTQLKPGLPLPVPLVNVGKDKAQPIGHARAFDPQAQTLLPEAQLRGVPLHLGIEALGVLALGGSTGGDLGLGGGDGGADTGAVGGVGVAPGGDVGEGGAGVGEFGGFAGEEVGVGLALGGEDCEGVGF